MTHKSKIWKAADFGKDKLQVVKTFLHYALDHMKAIDHLKINPSLLDSAKKNSVSAKTEHHMK